MQKTQITASIMRFIKNFFFNGERGIKGVLMAALLAFGLFIIIYNNITLGIQKRYMRKAIKDVKVVCESIGIECDYKGRKVVSIIKGKRRWTPSGAMRYNDMKFVLQVDDVSLEVRKDQLKIKEIARYEARYPNLKDAYIFESIKDPQDDFMLTAKVLYIRTDPKNYQIDVIIPELIYSKRSDLSNSMTIDNIGLSTTFALSFMDFLKLSWSGDKLNLIDYVQSVDVAFFNS